jgi:hypothetical protein
MVVEVVAGCSVAETVVGTAVTVGVEAQEVVMNTEIANVKNDRTILDLMQKLLFSFQIGCYVSFSTLNWISVT